MWRAALSPIVSTWSRSASSGAFFSASSSVMTRCSVSMPDHPSPPLMGPTLVNANQTHGVPQPCRHGGAVSVTDNNSMPATRFSGDQAAVFVDLEQLAVDRHRIEAMADDQGVAV